MKNIKLTIQYDGTNYAGWQIQKNAVSVQQTISEALEVLLKEKVNLIGSGRTDAGVHAFGQVANFTTQTEVDYFKFQYSLNAILPRDIAVIKTENVDEGFHSRFGAKKRSYFYLINSMKSPFYSPYSYYLRGELDCGYLNRLSRVFLGKNDFTSFSRKNTEVENKICSVYNTQWRRSGNFTMFYIEADRYLHGMVRTITGTLIYAHKNKLDEQYLRDVLAARDRETAGEAAPAKGLFLFKVRY